MADSTTSFRLEIAGADQVAAGFEKVKGAVAATSTEQEKAATATKSLGDAHNEANPKLTQFGSTLGMVGNAIGQTNPVLGSMVQTLGAATGTVTALEAAMGPLGIAIGVATTAFSLYERATAKANEATDHGADSLSNYISKLHQAADAAALFARTQEGAGTAIEQQARIAEVQARIADATARATNIWLGSGERQLARDEIAHLNRELHEAVTAEGEAERHEREYAAAERAQTFATAANAASAHTASPAPRRRGGGGARGGGHTAQLEAEMNAWAQDEADHQAAMDAELQSDREVAEKRTQFAADQQQHEIDAANLRETLLTKQVEAEEEAHQARLQHLAEEAQQWQQYGSAAQGVLTSISDLAASGVKNEGDAAKIRAYGQGINEDIQAAIDLATAIGSTIENPALAATKYASAAAHLAASVKAFAFSGGTGGGGASGGGSGGGGAMRPVSPAQGGDRGGGGAGITIMINGPIVGAGQMADAGDEIRRALQVSYERKPETL